MSDWIVDGLIGAEHTVLLLGKPHNGKSWIANQLAVSAASGEKFSFGGIVKSQSALVTIQ